VAKKKITVKEALKITRDHYKWREKNPKAVRHDWPEWKKLGYDFSHTDSGVFKNPLCLVAEGSCLACPLIALWMEGSEKIEETDLKFIVNCMIKTSLHMTAFNDNDPLRKKAKEAYKRIWEECDRALKKGIRKYKAPQSWLDFLKRLKQSFSTIKMGQGGSGRVRRERPERVRRERKSGRVRRVRRSKE
jgi:hypothetical protein